MRPHNSGHWTIDGAVTSSSSSTCGPSSTCRWVSPSARAPYSVMVNVLGGDLPDLYRGVPALHGARPRAAIHVYGKDVQPGRKVGHVTVCGDDLDDLLERGPPRRGLPTTESIDECRRRAGAGERRWSGSSWGSDSDWPVMEAAAEALTEFGVPHEVDVVSAHRMPIDMLDYGRRLPTGACA